MRDKNRHTLILLRDRLTRLELLLNLCVNSNYHFPGIETQNIPYFFLIFVFKCK